MKTDVYWNGKKSTWKEIRENYGDSYAEELEEFAKMTRPYTTITSEDGLIDINVY